MPSIPILGRIGLADILDYKATGIEASKLPLDQRVARFRQIGDALEDMRFPHVIVKTLAPAAFVPLIGANGWQEEGRGG